MINRKLTLAEKAVLEHLHKKGWEEQELSAGPYGLRAVFSKKDAETVTVDIPNYLKETDTDRFLAALEQDFSNQGVCTGTAPSGTACKAAMYESLLEETNRNAAYEDCMHIMAVSYLQDVPVFMHVFTNTIKSLEKDYKDSRLTNLKLAAEAFCRQALNFSEGYMMLLEQKTAQYAE